MGHQNNLTIFGMGKFRETIIVKKKPKNPTLLFKRWGNLKKIHLAIWCRTKISVETLFSRLICTGFVSGYRSL